MRQFPTVSVFDVDAILKQIRDIMDRASLAVQYVFLFTLAAGIVVLLAAVQSTRDERRYESAMLRTLGASRGTVLQGVAAEFSALGFLSGTLAAFGATGVGWILARRLFSLEFTLDPWVWVARPGVRHDSGGRERHAGDAQRGQHAADRDAARRIGFTCTSSISQPMGIGDAARRQRFDAHRINAGGQTGGIQRQAQFTVRILEQVVEYQRAPLILLVDDHAKLHDFCV